MTKYKTSKLTGALLDAAVAKAEGFGQWTVHTYDGETEAACILGPLAMERFEWSPSKTWEQGGSIIERERIALWASNSGWRALHPTADGNAWYQDGSIDADICDGEAGDTMLIAAMRAYVASKLGDEVDL